MILTRDKGQRMWGGGGGSSYSYGGGGGGESPSFDGFVSNEYYNQNFELLYKQEVTAGGTTTTTFMTAAPNIIVPVGTVTDETTQTTTVTSLVGPVAKNAIVLGNIMMVYDQTNNAIKVVNRDGSTAANFYATGGVSALGYNPGGGGGGGADLNALLDNINSSNIGDIAPTASEVGKCLVYNGNNQWAWATPGGGGGLTYGLSWSYGSVSGAQGGSYDGSATKSFVIPKDTSHLTNNAGFITSSALSGYLPLTGGTMTGSIIMKGVNIYMDPANSSSNATPDIVFRYGSGQEKARIWVDDTFSTVVGPQFRIYKTDGTQLVSTRLALASQIPSLAGYATQSWVANQGYATQTWVTGRGYITSAALSGYATQAWVNNQGYATQTWVNNQGFVTLGTQQIITATKTFSAYQDMKGINLDPTGDIRETTTNYGTFYLGYNAGGGNGFNLYNSLGGYLISGLSNGNVGIGNRAPAYNLDVTGNIHTTSAYYLDGKLLANNNSGLHFGYGFSAADLPTTIWGNGISFRSSDGNYGSCTNIGNTYGIMGTDFIGVTDKFRFEYDSGSNTVWVMKTDGSAVNFASLGGVSALGISTGGTPSVSALTVGTLTASSQLNVGGTSSFTGTSSFSGAMTANAMTVNGNISATNWQIPTTGYARFARLYLDSTRYVYVSNSHLYFYNGSSSVQIA